MDNVGAGRGKDNGEPAISMDGLLKIALNGAAAGADALQSGFMDDARLIKTEGKDIKTQADLSAQEQILAVLQSTGIPILAEEDAVEQAFSSKRTWLVDPLDGTFNFSRGFPIAAVSVALWEAGKPLLGVVHDVFNNDVFFASTGGGAWLGNRRIQVSTVKDRKDAALATGLPICRDYSSGSLTRFIESLQEFKKVRMLGSAAMMLAQVAAGRFDIYEEEDICLWDVAAGLALVQAAGGRFEFEPGSGPFNYHVRASNGLL